MDKDAMLNAWWEAKQKADEARGAIALEQELRKTVAPLFFEKIEIGTSYADLPNGYRLRLKASANRKIDEAALKATLDKLRDMNVNADALIRTKPEIITKEYKALTKEEKAVFDQAVIENPPSLALDVIPPKEEKK